MPEGTLPSELPTPITESSENAKQVNILHPTFADENLQNSPAGLRLERIINELNFIEQWSHIRTEYSLFKDTYDPEYHAQFSSEYAHISEAFDYLTEMADNDTYKDGETKAIDEAFLQKRKETREALHASQPENAHIIDIHISNDALTTAFFPFGIPHILHEIRQPLTGISGFNQLLTKNASRGNLSSYPHSKKMIEEGVANIATRIVQQTQKLDERFVYQIEDVTLTDIRYILNKNVPGKIGEITCSTEISPDISPALVAHWSKLWMGGLVENCVQNWKRKFEAEVKNAKDEEREPDTMEAKLSVGLTRDGNLEMVFEDNGKKEFAEIIVKEGFIAAQKAGIHGYGRDDVESTGIGMAGHEKAIQRFGGTLKAENILDENGTCQGVRVRAIVPATIVQPIPSSPQETLVTV